MPLKVINLIPKSIRYSPTGRVEDIVVIPASGITARFDLGDPNRGFDLSTEFGIFAVKCKVDNHIVYVCEVGQDCNAGNGMLFNEFAPTIGDTVYITSFPVMQALQRWDVISPATGPEDGVLRDGNEVLAVTKFISLSY